MDGGPIKTDHFVFVKETSGNIVRKPRRTLNYLAIVVLGIFTLLSLVSGLMSQPELLGGVAFFGLPLVYVFYSMRAPLITWDVQSRTILIGRNEVARSIPFARVANVLVTEDPRYSNNRSYARATAAMTLTTGDIVELDTLSGDRKKVSRHADALFVTLVAAMNLPPATLSDTTPDPTLQPEIRS